MFNYCFFSAGLHSICFNLDKLGLTEKKNIDCIKQYATKNVYMIVLINKKY